MIAIVVVVVTRGAPLALVLSLQGFPHNGQGQNGHHNRSQRQRNDDRFVAGIVAVTAAEIIVAVVAGVGRHGG